MIIRNTDSGNMADYGIKNPALFNLLLANKAGFSLKTVIILLYLFYLSDQVHIVLRFCFFEN